MYVCMCLYVCIHACKYVYMYVCPSVYKRVRAMCGWYEIYSYPFLLVGYSKKIFTNIFSMPKEVNTC